MQVKRYPPRKSQEEKRRGIVAFVFFGSTKIA